MSKSVVTINDGGATYEWPGKINLTTIRNFAKGYQGGDAPGIVRGWIEDANDRRYWIFDLKRSRRRSGDDYVGAPSTARWS
jgi:hypothetical protein